MNDQAIQKAGETGAIAREGFGSREIERRGETSTSALVAQARAEIEARYVMAMQRPRVDADVRVRLLAESSRPGFARGAIYSIPRGTAPGRLTNTPGRIEGLSIRFAEAAIRLSGNIFQSTQTTYDDDFKRIVRVSCVDLETNATYSKDLVIDKTTERREVKEGRVVLGSRQNSTGATVYIIQATEEELLQKEASLVSRALRTEALRLVPSDVLEECEQRIVLTRKTETAKDPNAARKQLADAFAGIGVMPSDLGLYVGAELEAASPAQLEDLRGLYAAVRDGEITFNEALKAVTTLRDVPAGGAEQAQTKQAQGVVAKLKDRAAKVKAKSAKKDEKPAAPAAAETTKQTPAARANAPSNEEAKAEQAPPLDAKCITCGNPVGRDAVATYSREGDDAWRHAGCAAPEPVT
jgi:hypothetical protein